MADKVLQTSHQASLDMLGRIVGQGGQLEPAVQRQALDILGQILSQRAPTSRGIGRVGGRHLVYVHGICPHAKGYSNDWWRVLHGYTTAFDDGNLDDTRHEVLWSDVVHPDGVRALSLAQAPERAEFAARIRGALEERAAAHALATGPNVASPQLARDLIVSREVFALRGLSIPGMNCIDDFTSYMFDDSIRGQVIGRFTGLVRHLLDDQDELDIISHSWGTVVAYEALRELEDQGLTAPRIRNFFTVGAALSLYPVKQRLRPANQDGHRPAMVRRWENLNAHGDPVGGPLQGRPFQVDVEFLDLDNLGCGWLDFNCAHGSYFVEGNVRVNRDIFGAFIDQA